MATLGKSLVRFDTDGGSTVPDAMVTKGQMLTAPVNPIKEGFVLENWYSDATKKTVFDFETPINEDTTLYAKWVRLGLEFSLANRLYTAVFDGENKSSITVHYDADFSTLGVEDIAFSNPKSANQKINNLSFDLEKNQLTVNVTVGGITADYTISLEVELPQDKYYIVPQKGSVQSQIVAYDIKFYIVNDNELIDYRYFETNDPTILETDYKKSVLVIDKSDTELQGKDIIVLAAGLNAEGKYVGSGKETFNLDNEVRQLEIPFKRTPNSFEIMSDIREWYRQNVNNDNDLRAGISLSVETPTRDLKIENVNLHYFREYFATNKVFSHFKYSPFYRGKKPAYGNISNGNLVNIYRENSYLPNGDWAIGLQNSRFYLNRTDIADPVVVGEYEEGEDVVAKLTWR